MSLYKQCGWITIAREVFATRQLFSRASYHAQKTVKPHLGLAPSAQLYPLRGQLVLIVITQRS